SRRTRPMNTVWNRRDHWDDATRKVIAERLQPPGPLRFFSPEEARLLQAVLDRLLPQPERAEPIPVLAAIDRRLADRAFDGYFYEGCPEDDAAHRLGLQALAAMAQQVHGQPFDQLPAAAQDTLLVSI